MADRENVISDLEEQIAWIRDNDFHKFPGWGHAVLAMRDAIALLKEQAEEIKALRQLVEWAVECDFGYDNLYYKEYVSDEEIANMGYTEGLIYIAKKAVARDG